LITECRAGPVCVVFPGFVTWKEFHVHFLLAKGYKQNETLQHVEDYDSLSIDPEGRHFYCYRVPYFSYCKAGVGKLFGVDKLAVGRTGKFYPKKEIKQQF